MKMVKYGELLVTDFVLLCFLVKAVLLMREEVRGGELSMFVERSMFDGHNGVARSSPSC